MKKEFRYILRPQVETMLNKTQGSNFYRPKTSSYRSSTRKCAGDLSHEGFYNPNKDQNNWGFDLYNSQFDPNNTIFKKKKSKRRRHAYKNDYLTRNLKKSPGKGDHFCTMYNQDFERSYKYVKPA